MHPCDQQKYKLRDPLDPEANLGPVVDVASANRVKADIQDALSKGAQGLIDVSAFSLAKVLQFSSIYVVQKILKQVGQYGLCRSPTPCVCE